MSIPTKVATALAAHLQAGSYAFTIEARVSYNPDKALKDLPADGTPDVVVIPRSRKISMVSRGERGHEVQVDIGVRAKVDADSLNDIDGLNDFCEQLVNQVDRASLNLAGDGRATFLGIEQPVFVDTDALRDKPMFLSVIAVRYQVTSLVVA